MSDYIDDLFNQLRPSPYVPSGNDPNAVSQEQPVGPGNPQPAGWIQDGVVTASSFDTTAPSLPTGLTLSSDVAFNSDGSSFVRLLVGLTQPADADLFGSYVEVTSFNDGGDPPNPVWDRPHTLFIPKGETQARWDNVQGVTTFWGRARAADVLGNISSWTATVTHTTVGDASPPPIPNVPSLTAGYRGFGATWSGGDAVDLAYYELRFALATAAPDGDPGAWTTIQVRGTAAFIGNLTIPTDPTYSYWVEVRGVDLSGNESAYSPAASVTPVLIGASDVAFNSVISNILASNEIDASTIRTGTLTITADGSFADGIAIFDGSGNTVGTWTPTGLKIIDPADPSRYIWLDSGQLKLVVGGSTLSAITPDGIDASQITFGKLSGGTNLVRNSSFELSGFVVAPSSITFTNDTDPTAWKSANWNSAPTANINVTAITELAITSWTL